MKEYEVHYISETGKVYNIVEAEDKTEARKRFAFWYPEVEIIKIKESK